MTEFCRAVNIDANVSCFAKGPGALIILQDQCRYIAPPPTGPGCNDNHAWYVDENTGTLFCEDSNTSRYCLTVAKDSFRNVSLQLCSGGGGGGIGTTQAWNVAALDPLSQAANDAHSALQL